MVLLYVPPVQNLIRREVTAYASKATGMQIQVERIDLRFPLNLLVRGVEVIQQPDTLLSLESLNVRVQAWPLLKGKVEVDEVTLSRVAFNSANNLCFSRSSSSSESAATSVSPISNFIAFKSGGTSLRVSRLFKRTSAPFSIPYSSVTSSVEKPSATFKIAFFNSPSSIRSSPFQRADAPVFIARNHAFFRRGRDAFRAGHQIISEFV